MTVQLTRTAVPQIITYTTVNMDIKVEAAGNTTQIVFQSYLPIMKTGCISSTYETLNREFPSVFETRCGNYLGLPFSEEVKDTEIGHMFEHILIQNLKEMKNEICDDPVLFSAETEWDWVQNPRGMYSITIESDCDYSDVLRHAIEKSIAVTEKVLNGFVKA